MNASSDATGHVHPSSRSSSSSPTLFDCNPESAQTLCITLRIRLKRVNSSLNTMNALGSGNGISKQAFVGAGTFLTVLPALVVAARLAGNVKNVRRLAAADYFSIVAVVLLAGMFANFMLIVNGISDPNLSIPYLIKLVTASGPVSASATWVAKAPVLLLYVQIFGIQRWIRFVSYTTLAVTFFWLLAWNIWLLVEFLPFPAVIDATYLLSRTHSGSVAGVSSAVIGVIADIVIFVLPLPSIVRLRLPVGKKIGLFLAFLTGIFAVAASATGLYFKVLSLSGVATDLKNAMICTIIELSIAIMVSCVPALPAFWSTIVANSEFYSVLTSAFSRVTLTRSSQSKHSQGPSEHSNISNGDLKNVPHQYDILDDTQSIRKLTPTHVRDTEAYPLHDL
ncbi:hypothetical protein F5Y15DRAFT_402328 [Xylariaceae sp. FL0016]|nr:hypothetical protein F5Y15DRAFT_402328 [Xylariaceae sp. FL0016]